MEFNIALYLERFKTLEIKDSSIRSTIVGAIKDTCGFDVPISDIVVTDGEARIGVSGPKRMALFVKKDALERLVRERLAQNISLK